MLKPFFCFYGGKYRAAPHYPKPLHDTIIEPFAGGAGYSVRNYTHNVILNDVDPIIYGLWDYLIKVSSDEIMKLPILIDHLDNFNLPQESKWLIGFWMNTATSQPRKQFSTWALTKPNSFWGEVIRERIAKQVPLIKHWKIYNKSYWDLPNDRATWFIDPPYNNKAGSHYKYNKVDYSLLGNYCMGRLGQTIVCEQLGADWLPFKFFREIMTAKGKNCPGTSKEVIYYQENN